MLQDTKTKKKSRVHYVIKIYLASKIFIRGLLGAFVLDPMLEFAYIHRSFIIDVLTFGVTAAFLVVVTAQYFQNQDKSTIDTRPMIIMDPDRLQIEIKNNEIEIPFINIGKITAWKLKIEHCINTTELNENFDKNNNIQYEREQDILPQEKIYRHFPIEEKYLKNHALEIYFMFRITYNRSKSIDFKRSIYTRIFTFKKNEDGNIRLYHMRAIDTK